MRWIRKKSALIAVLILMYFFVVYIRHDGFAVLAANFVVIVMVFGSALADRLTDDPSAIFIEKPWRVMRPSAGDTFRLFGLGGIVLMTLPILILKGGYRLDSAILEGGLIALVLFGYEWTRFAIQRVRWFGSGIDVRSKFGRHVSMRWSDVKDIHRDILNESIVFRDRAGNRAKIDRRLRGYPEFIRDAERYVSPELRPVIRQLK